MRDFPILQTILAIPNAISNLAVEENFAPHQKLFLNGSLSLFLRKGFVEESQACERIYGRQNQSLHLLLCGTFFCVCTIRLILHAISNTASQRTLCHTTRNSWNGVPVLEEGNLCNVKIFTDVCFTLGYYPLSL